MRIIRMTIAAATVLGGSIVNVAAPARGQSWDVPVLNDPMSLDAPTAADKPVQSLSIQPELIETPPAEFHPDVPLPSRNPHWSDTTPQPIAPESIGSGVPAPPPVVTPDSKQSTKPDVKTIWAPVYPEPAPSPIQTIPSFGSAIAQRYYADYDNGFRIRPFDPQTDVFDLKINGWIQFRHGGYSSNVDTFTDATGTTRLVEDRNAFEVERGRLIFSGHAVDRRLSYFLQFDGDTDGENQIDLLDYHLQWQTDDWGQFRLGRQKLPGSRSWLISPLDTRLTSRSLATNFFRPGRTAGVQYSVDAGWLGNVTGLIGNNFRTVNVPGGATDDKFTYTLGHVYEPLGDFGSKLIDFGSSDGLKIRFGQTYTFAPQNDARLEEPDDDEDFIRLADGTRLNDPSALVSGVTVASFDVSLYTIDFAAKYRGWSMDTEGYFRRLGNLASDGQLPVTEVDQLGFYVQTGVFLVDRRWDVNVRFAEAHDSFGTGNEMAIGTNWFPTADERLRVTFDVAEIDSSPVTATAANILVGDDGTVFRSQLEAQF